MDGRPPDDQPGRMELLEQELARLASEQTNALREIRHLKWVVVILVLVSISLGAIVGSVRSGKLELSDVFGSAMPKKLESKEFGLYNREGKRVLFADYDKWGYPSLVFLDLDLNYKMGLKIYGDGSPGMVFYDKTGTRASFRMGEKGESKLELLGENQKGGILLDVTPDGTPRLKLTNAQGRVLFEVPDPPPASESEPAKHERPKGPRR